MLGCRRCTKNGKLDKRVKPLARDLYDGEVAYLDDRIGRFLTELEQRGYGAQWRMEGVDINPDEIEMGRSRGLDLPCGTLESQGYGPGTFDAVAAFSVLEHLQARATARLEPSKVA